jgi:CheY-like chemotaxis protein
MKTILFADDDRHVREYCKRELEEDGYRVLLSRDGSEAIGVFRREIPDLVVLDISMPRSNGLETAERLKQVEPHVPVIFFTPYDEDCLKDGRSRLATACVEKCEDLTALKQAIARALAGNQAGAPFRLGLPP